MPPDPPDFLFWYRLSAVRAIDGDTIEGDIDLGFRVAWRTRLRLFGLDTPELNDPDPAIRARALAAKAFVANGLEGNANVVIRSHKDRADKYGRWLAVVHYLDGDGVWHDLNQELLDSGLARPYLA